MILDSERAYLLEMRSLSTDAEGREVLVGLNFEETAFYMAHVRVALNHKRSADHEEQAERYLRLHDKHEVARFQVLGAENQKRVDKPTLN
jgi:hypothetical protein